MCILKFLLLFAYHCQCFESINESKNTNFITNFNKKFNKGLNEEFNEEFNEGLDEHLNKKINKDLDNDAVPIKKDASQKYDDWASKLSGSFSIESNTAVVPYGTNQYFAIGNDDLTLTFNGVKNRSHSIIFNNANVKQDKKTVYVILDLSSTGTGKLIFKSNGEGVPKIIFGDISYAGNTGSANLNIVISGSNSTSGTSAIMEYSIQFINGTLNRGSGFLSITLNQGVKLNLIADRKIQTIIHPISISSGGSLTIHPSVPLSISSLYYNGTNFSGNDSVTINNGKVTILETIPQSLNINILKNSQLFGNLTSYSGSISMYSKATLGVIGNSDYSMGSDSSNTIQLNGNDAVISISETLFNIAIQGSINANNNRFNVTGNNSSSICFKGGVNNASYITFTNAGVIIDPNNSSEFSNNFIFGGTDLRLDGSFLNIKTISGKIMFKNNFYLYPNGVSINNSINSLSIKNINYAGRGGEKKIWITASDSTVNQLNLLNPLSNCKYYISESATLGFPFYFIQYSEDKKLTSGNGKIVAISEFQTI